MKTRVIVLLGVPAGYCCTYYGTRDEACQAIAAWRDKQAERIKNGLKEFDTTLWEVKDSDDPTVTVAAIMGQFIVGMYLPSDERTAADRMADAFEKQVNEGEGWRDDSP